MNKGGLLKRASTTKSRRYIGRTQDVTAWQQLAPARSWELRSQAMYRSPRPGGYSAALRGLDAQLHSGHSAIAPHALSATHFPAAGYATADPDSRHPAF